MAFSTELENRDARASNISSADSDENNPDNVVSPIRNDPHRLFKQAKKENIDALFTIAGHYYFGRSGFPQDTEQALKYYLKAAIQEFDQDSCGYILILVKKIEIELSTNQVIENHQANQLLDQNPYNKLELQQKLRQLEAKLQLSDFENRMIPKLK